MAVDPGPVSPLRVLQEDSVHLDHELCEILCSKLKDAVKYCSFAPHDSLELKALARFLVLFMHSSTHGATYGMKVLDLQHYRAGEGSRPVSRTRIFFLTLLRSCEEVLAVSGRSRRALWRHLGAAFHLCSIAHFLVFLLRADFATMWHRVAGVKLLAAHPRVVRPLTFEFTDRELLWHTFAEFLAFLLPVVDFAHLQRAFWRFLGHEPTAGHPKKSLTGFLCHACEMPPVIAHSGRCAHIFCYVCFHRLATAAQPCPTCGADCNLTDMAPWRAVG